MRKFCLFMRSIWKNVILKRKFRPFFALMTDPSFRADINYMYKITKHCRGTEKALVRFGSICMGHRLVYPEYADSLTQDMDIPHIKVAIDGDGYRVIDGNHRFHAMKRWVKPDDLIFVDLLK